MQWIMIAIQIVNMFWPKIQDCITVDRVRRYGILAQWMVLRAGQRAAREAGYSRAAARKAGRDAVDETKRMIDEATDEELESAIDQMRDYAAELAEETEE